MAVRQKSFRGERWNKMQSPLTFGARALIGPTASLAQQGRQV